MVGVRFSRGRFCLRAGLGRRDGVSGLGAGGGLCGCWIAGQFGLGRSSGLCELGHGLPGSRRAWSYARPRKADPGLNSHSQNTFVISGLIDSKCLRSRATRSSCLAVGTSESERLELFDMFDTSGVSDVAVLD